VGTVGLRGAGGRGWSFENGELGFRKRYKKDTHLAAGVKYGKIKTSITICLF